MNPKPGAPPPPPHTHLHVVKELVGCLGTVAGEHVGAQAVNGPGGGDEGEGGKGGRECKCAGCEWTWGGCEGEGGRGDEHVGAQAVNGPGGGMKAGLLERPARGTALHAFTPPYHFMPFDASNPGACFWIATLVRCM